MKFNGRHRLTERDHDFYPTPRAAVEALLNIEGKRIPRHIWEPACGDGAIVQPLQDAGKTVYASDLIDRGAGYLHGVNYLTAQPPAAVQGLVTNPPFSLAEEFIAKALQEVSYSAWLLRISFLESTRRMAFFQRQPPSRIWVASRRLPMMHRDGWEGPKTTSNVCFCWFVWDEFSTDRTVLDWYDWQDI